MLIRTTSVKSTN